MDSWSQRRKLIYAVIFAVVIVVAASLVYFTLFYKAPTCFDSVQNGNESGVDCGGSCSRLCQDSYMPPSVAWTRFERVAPGLFNVASYIINPNATGEALKVPYHMILYDSQGSSIADASGFVTLPPHRNTLAFLGSVPVGQRQPIRALFEFKSDPNWHSRFDPLTALEISDKNYSDSGTGSLLSVMLKNNSTQSIGDITVYAVLYDESGNVLGFSKTLIDEVPALGSSLAPFTWSDDRQGKVISIEILPVAE